MSHLRKYALALPEAEEGTHFGRPAFSVRGKGFVSVSKDGRVRLRLPEDRTAAAETDHPTGQRIVQRGECIGFEVPLADLDGQKLNALVRSAWFDRAPKRLAAAFAAAESGTAPDGSDLPRGIGRPATSALLGAGIDTLAKVAEHSERELLAMHGVGPKAVRILADELARRGEPLR